MMQHAVKYILNPALQGLTIFALLTTTSSYAEMWKCKDSDGNTRYTNSKKEAATFVDCAALNLDPIESRASGNSKRGTRAMSADALIVLTTVGYWTGAADDCKVVPNESNVLSSGIAGAINLGNYGDPVEANLLLNNARQKGIAQAAAREVDCAKIAESVRKYVRSMLQSK